MLAFHHRPELGVTSDTLVVVHVADALSHAIADGSTADPSCGGRLDVAFVERAGFGAELPRWRALAEQELAAASTAP